MSAFTIDITGKISVEKITEQVQQVIDNELEAFGFQTVAEAKELCPVDEGFLRNSITFDKQPLSVEIIVGADYGAYLEFGTRAFAASYVASLPADWQTFAAQFRGSGGGTFKDMVARITEWVHRKGLGSGFTGKIGVAGTYSIKSRKRTGNKSTQETEDRSAAYLIALSILRKGIKPHPFLYPAISNNVPKLMENLKAQLK